MQPEVRKEGSTRDARQASSWPGQSACSLVHLGRKTHRMEHTSEALCHIPTAEEAAKH